MRWLVYVFFLFIPIQTVYIFSSPIVGSPEGVWQYGVIGLYGTDFLVMGIIISFIWWYTNKQTQWSVVRPVVQEKLPLFLLLCGWGVLLMWSCIALLWAPAQWVSLYAILRLVEIGCIVWALRMIPWSLGGALSAYVGMAMIQSVVAWHQFLAQHIHAHSWLGMAAHASSVLGDSVVESTLRRFLRAYGTFPHPNMLGIYFAVAVLLCIALSWYIRKKWQAYCLLVAWACVVSGLILTFSRGAWIAALLGSLSMIVMMSLLRTRIRIPYERFGKINAVMTIFVVILLGTMSYGLWEPLSTRLGVGGLTRLEQRSLSERGSSLREGMSALLQEFPLGTGIGQYTYSIFLKDKNSNTVRPYYSYQPVHAVPILIVSELGLMGIVGMIFLIAGYIWLITIRIRAISSVFDAVRVALTFSLGVVILIAFLTDHFLWTTHAGGMMLATTLALICAVPSYTVIHVALPPSNIQNQ